MSANVLLFNDLQFSMEDFDQSANRADRSVTLMPELHEAPIMFLNGEFRYKDLFFALSTDIPVLF